MMIAISGLPEGIYSVGDTKTGHSSMYKEDGTHISGDLILDSQEVAFMIWRQKQSPNISEQKLRAQWFKKRN
jgi:hypothetical protein